MYLRVLGKYTDDPLNSITLSPNLSFVEDEDFQDLLYLGLVTRDGWYTGSATYERNKHGKDKNNLAIDISELFRYTGEVCHTIDPCASYPEGECPYEGVVEKSKCCNYDVGLEYIVCEDVVIEDDIIYDCPPDAVGTETCTVVTCEQLYDPAYCVEYTNDWIFNIGDLVEYLWDVNNQGVKLLQVRFYPRCDPAQ